MVVEQQELSGKVDWVAFRSGIRQLASEILDRKEIESMFAHSRYVVGQTTLPFRGVRDMEIYLAHGTVGEAIQRRFDQPTPEQIQKTLARWREFSSTPPRLPEGQVVFQG